MGIPFKLAYIQGRVPVEPENFPGVSVGNVGFFRFPFYRFYRINAYFPIEPEKPGHFQPEPPGNFPVQPVPIPAYMII